MHRTLRSFRLLLAAVLLAAISACGGGGGGALVKDQSGVPPLGQGLTPQVERLIAEKYSSHPDLKRAAEGWANAKLAQMKAAVDTGAYSKELTSRSLHAQVCLNFKAERYGVSFEDPEIVQFLSALTPTPAHLRAFNAANSLSSGHPKSISFNEAVACARGGF